MPILPPGFARVGAAQVEPTTSTLYVRYGKQGARVAASKGEGLRTVAFEVQPGRDGLVSLWTSLYVIRGAVRVLLATEGGDVFPTGGERLTAGQGGHEFRLSDRLGFEEEAGKVQVYWIAEGGEAEFVVDALAVTASQVAYPYAANMGPKGLWRAGAKELRERGGLVPLGLTGEAIRESYFEGGPDTPIQVGDRIRVLHDQIANDQGEQGARLSLYARVTETQVEEAPGDAPHRQKVKLAEKDNPLREYLGGRDGRSASGGIAVTPSGGLGTGGAAEEEQAQREDAARRRLGALQSALDAKSGVDRLAVLSEELPEGAAVQWPVEALERGGLGSGQLVALVHPDGSGPDTAAVLTARLTQAMAEGDAVLEVEDPEAPGDAALAEEAFPAGSVVYPVVSDVLRWVSEIEGGLATHTADESNPHSVTAAQAGAVAKTGDQMSGPLTLPGDPEEALHAAPKRWIEQKIADLVGSAPEALDTLSELADALGEDANYAASTAQQIGTLGTEISVLEAAVDTLEATKANTSAVPSVLEDLDDVGDLSGAEVGQAFVWSGSEWVPGTVAGGSGGYNQDLNTFDPVRFPRVSTPHVELESSTFFGAEDPQLEAGDGEATLTYTVTEETVSGRVELAGEDLTGDGTALYYGARRVDAPQPLSPSDRPTFAGVDAYTAARDASVPPSGYERGLALMQTGAGGQDLGYPVKFSALLHLRAGANHRQAQALFGFDEVLRYRIAENGEGSWRPWREVATRQWVEAQDYGSGGSTYTPPQDLSPSARPSFQGVNVYRGNAPSASAAPDSYPDQLTLYSSGNDNTDLGYPVRYSSMLTGGGGGNQRAWQLLFGFDGVMRYRTPENGAGAWRPWQRLATEAYVEGQPATNLFDQTLNTYDPAQFSSARVDTLRSYGQGVQVFMGQGQRRHGLYSSGNTFSVRHRATDDSYLGVSLAAEPHRVRIADDDVGGGLYRAASRNWVTSYVSSIETGGGSGADYTGTDGVSVVGNEISVDNTVARTNTSDTPETFNRGVHFNEEVRIKDGEMFYAGQRVQLRAV